MEFSSSDKQLIAQALMSAIGVETDDAQRKSYREMLKQLHIEEQGRLQSKRSQQQAAVSFDDGFRYDYDDASDLIE